MLPPFPLVSSNKYGKLDHLHYDEFYFQIGIEKHGLEPSKDHFGYNPDVCLVSFRWLWRGSHCGGGRGGGGGVKLSFSSMIGFLDGNSLLFTMASLLGLMDSKGGIFFSYKLASPQPAKKTSFSPAEDGGETACFEVTKCSTDFMTIAQVTY